MNSVLGKIRTTHGTRRCRLSVLPPALGVLAVKGVSTVPAQNQRYSVILRKVVVADRALLVVVAGRHQDGFGSGAGMLLPQLRTTHLACRSNALELFGRPDVRKQHRRIGVEAEHADQNIKYVLALLLAPLKVRAGAGREGRAEMHVVVRPPRALDQEAVRAVVLEDKDALADAARIRASTSCDIRRLPGLFSLTRINRIFFSYQRANPNMSKNSAEFDQLFCEDVSVNGSVAIGDTCFVTKICRWRRTR